MAARVGDREYHYITPERDTGPRKRHCEAALPACTTGGRAYFYGPELQILRGHPGPNMPPRELHFRLFPRLGLIGASFPCMDSGAARATFGGFGAVRMIGTDFFSGSKLRKADLRPMRSLRSIGHRFLSACPYLEAAALPRTRRVGMGDHFISRCPNLRVVGLRGVRAVAVGGAFLAMDPSLRGGFGMEWARDVKRIGPQFMMLSGVTSVDTRPLRRLEELGSHFLAESGLTAAPDLGFLSGLAAPPTHFLEGCPGLAA